MNDPLDLRIIAISPDDPLRRPRLVEDLERLAAGGATAFMFREKSLAERDFIVLGRDLRQACDQLGLLFILNERSALTEPIGAPIVHLTWRSVGLRRARDEVGPDVRLGRSVHSAEEARAAADFDYLIYGPVFATPSKEGLVPTQGLENLATLVTDLDLPLVAVGGIVAERLPGIRATGAVGVAAIRALFDDDPGAAARAFKDAWEGRE